MLRVIVILLSLFVLDANASGCRNNLEENHDFVAIVKIEKESALYENAFDAKVERVIYRYGEENKNFYKSKLFQIKQGKVFTLIESGVFKIESSIEKGNHKIRSISQVYPSCEKRYVVGSKIKLFAREVEQGIYKSSSSWTGKIK